ncbi:MAG: hypothetical protein WA154_11080 [Moraxellaceae bacterium]
MNMLSPDFIAWTAFALVMGVGLVVLGWALGLHDRDQRVGCQLSHTPTQLAQAEWLLSRSRANCKTLVADLQEANERIRRLQESNQALVIRAVLPPEVRRGG